MHLVLRATHTHLYPGAGGSIAPEPPLRWSATALDLPCVVEFSDGRAAPATLEGFDADGARLSVAAYRTLAGTEVAAGRWLLEIGWRENTAHRFRVRSRLALSSPPDPA